MEKKNNLFKIYRTPSTRVFEWIVGLIVLAIWLINIRNIVNHSSGDWGIVLFMVGFGTIFPIGTLWYSYHPSADDMPFLKIVNCRQVHYLSLCSRMASLLIALFFLWISSVDFFKNEIIFLAGMVTFTILLLLNPLYFMYKIFRHRKQVEVEYHPKITYEKLLYLGSLILIVVLNFALRHLNVLDGIPSFWKGVLEGLIIVCVLLGLKWGCQKCFGMFKKIDDQ